MGWQLIAQAAPGVQLAIASGLAQRCYLAHQQVNLLLLPGHYFVKLLYQVFGVSGLDFEVSQALVGCAGLGRLWVCHGVIGHQNPIALINHPSQ